jgi:uncharacterized sodium:solute symporter family permease YidK
VLSFGVIAYILAIFAEGVYTLVEEASAFGSAGLVVCIVFAARSDFGTKYSAISSLLGGISSYILFAYILQIDYPFVGSLMVSLCLFVVFGFLKVKPSAQSKIDIV